jgi:hypothetical protein
MPNPAGSGDGIPNQASYTDLGNGAVRDNGNVTRCVRGNGTGEAADEYAVEPENHYSVGTDTVVDNYTGLTWQRGHSPDLMAWSAAPDYCASLTLDGLSGWRVPTITGIATTVNEARVGKAVVDVRCVR